MYFSRLAKQAGAQTHLKRHPRWWCKATPHPDTGAAAKHGRGCIQLIRGKCRQRRVQGNHNLGQGTPHCCREVRAAVIGIACGTQCGWKAGTELSKLACKYAGVDWRCPSQASSQGCRPARPQRLCPWVSAGCDGHHQQKMAAAHLQSLTTTAMLALHSQASDRGRDVFGDARRRVSAPWVLPLNPCCI